MSVMMVKTKCKLNNTELFLKLFHIQCKEIGNNKYYEETTECEKWQWDFALIMTLERKWKTQSHKTDYARKRSTEFELQVRDAWSQVSCKSTTAANVDLAKSLWNNSLKNNHIIVDKIYCPHSLFVFFTNFSFQIYFSTAENRHKNNNSGLGNSLKLDLSE